MMEDEKASYWKLKGENRRRGWRFGNCYRVKLGNTSFRLRRASSALARWQGLIWSEVIVTEGSDNWSLMRRHCLVSGYSRQSLKVTKSVSFVS